MKKFFAAFSALFLFSACGPATSSEKDFERKMGKIHDYYFETYIKDTFTVDVPNIGTGKIAFHADVSSFLVGESKISFEHPLQYDFSNPKNLKSALEYHVLVDNKGSMFTDPFSFETDFFRTFVDNIIYFRADSFSYKNILQTPKEEISEEAQQEQEKEPEMIEEEFVFSPDEVLNTWYEIGADEIAAFTGASTERFFNIDEWKNLFNTPIEKVFQNIHIWKFVKGLPEENGMMRFEVELDEEKAKKSIIGFWDAMEEVTKKIGDERSIEQLQKDRKESEAALEADFPFDLRGILGVSLENPEIFTFEGNLSEKENKNETGIEMQSLETEISVEFLEKTKKIHLLPSDADEQILFESQEEEGVTKFSLKGGVEAKNMILDGEYSDSHCNFVLYSYQEGGDDFVFRMKEKEGKYSGNILSGENLSIEIREMFQEDDVWNYDITFNKMVDIQGTFEFSLEESEGIKIEAPTETKPYSEFEEKIEKMDLEFLNPQDLEEMGLKQVF